MKRNDLSTCGGALICALISGCSTPSPFNGQLQQAEPRSVSPKLQLPSSAEVEFVVAGLKQGAIPQGMVFVPDTQRVLTSHYFDHGPPSCIVSTDWKSGKAVSTFQLLEPEGRPHTGHVGGLAYDGSSLWIASDHYLYRCDPAAMNDAGEAESLTLQEKFRTEATEEVAFCSAFNQLVWAGEFAMGSTFPTHASHHMSARDGNERTGWLCGYDVNEGFEHPRKLLSIPDRTQGAVATESHIFLSRSYGRRNRSTIDIYENPLIEPPHTFSKTSKGHKVPLWFLDEENRINSLDLPPMSENIFIHEDMLYILFESGAQKFRFFGKQPLDYIIKIQLQELIR